MCVCMYLNRHRGLGWVDCELGELSWDLLYFTSMPGLVFFLGVIYIIVFIYMMEGCVVGFVQLHGRFSRCKNPITRWAFLCVF